MRRLLRAGGMKKRSCLFGEMQKKILNWGYLRAMVPSGKIIKLSEYLRSEGW